MNSKNFVVEVINLDGEITYIIRQPNGVPIRICKSSDDIATFFGTIKFESANG